MKSMVRVIISAVMLLLVSGCTMFSDSKYNNAKYKDGYFIVVLNEKFDDVYDATLQAIERGQTRDANDNAYNIKVNKKVKNKAVIGAISSLEPSDFVEVIMIKTSENKTRVTVKYGRQGDKDMSSALINIIKANIHQPK